MTDSFVTQCPHCRTSFRVSRAQLGAAHGAVRCGACLHVFNASQHLLGEQPAPLKPPAPATPPASPRPVPPANPPSPATPVTPAKAPPAMPEQATPAGKQPSKTLWIHDDLDLDSIDLDEALAQLEEQEHQLSQEFLASARAPDPAERFLSAHESAKPYDEEWAESLLQPARPASPATSSAAPPATPPAASLPAPAEAPAANPASANPRSEPTFGLDAEDSDELHDDAPSLRAERDEPDALDLDEEPEAGEEIGDAQYHGGRSEPPLRDEGLRHLAQEPLQLDWQRPKKAWGRKVGWLLMNLIGLAALSGQYISYHFEELARQDQYRPWFEQLCPEIGCKLPSKVEISLIKSSNLVVRSHPEFAGALVVDAILYNRASFSQPFPLLELRFADLNGQLLASRRFKPSEYLAGELAGQAEMPPQTPIHISLDILDPGSKAVNYSLSFHSPE